MKPTGSSSKASGNVQRASGSTSMNSGSGKTQRFRLQKPDGTVKTYGSRLEAQADQARYGGVVRF